MDMIFVLIILAVILLSGAVAVFFWAVRTQQFDDLEMHAYSVLREDQLADAPTPAAIGESTLNESTHDDSTQGDSTQGDSREEVL